MTETLRLSPAAVASCTAYLLFDISLVLYSIWGFLGNAVVCSLYR